MESEEWRVKSGERRVKSGECRVGSGDREPGEDGGCHPERAKRVEGSSR